ncbi:gluconeogenesis factor YvcK family protein [Clostridium sp. DL1XJH146]
MNDSSYGPDSFLKKDKDSLKNKALCKGPKIVAIGGGTGLSTILRGIKEYTSNITAIVTMGDDGGGSGMLRQDLKMLPPGDIRNCIVALAETEPVMKELLQYRFKDGKLKDQSFGNLFLAAMDGISDNFQEAVQKMSSVLAVTGKVLPVTLEDMILKAELENGNIIIGESMIPKEVIKQKSKIKKLYIEPKEAKALEEAIQAILEADAIILGPGSLFTSLIPNLLVKDILESVSICKGVKIYISNVMTQPGETDDYTLEDHLRALYNHANSNIIDYVLVNTNQVGQDIRNKYSKERAIPVEYDKKSCEEFDVKYIEEDIASVENNFIRHDSYKLASLIINIIDNKKR